MERGKGWRVSGTGRRKETSKARNRAVMDRIPPGLRIRLNISVKDKVREILVLNYTSFLISKASFWFANIVLEKSRINKLIRPNLRCTLSFDIYIYKWRHFKT